MSKRIVSIGNVHQTEVGDAKKIESVPIFTIELTNRIREVNPNKDIDLQFDLSPAAYQGLFKKDLTFTTMEEMDKAKDLIAYIHDLESSDIEYNVLNSPFTNSILVFTSEPKTFKFPNLKSYTYMVDVLKWMTDQEKHFT